MVYAKLNSCTTIKELINCSIDSELMISKTIKFTKEDKINIFVNLPSEIKKYKAPHIAIIYNWLEYNEVENIKFYKLYKPYVFGGEIVKRSGFSHFNGQCLLTSKKQLISASFGVMDGHKSLSGDIIKGYSGNNLENTTLNDEVTFTEKIDDGVYYFLGNIHGHFGHFLLEGLSRLWALEYLPIDIRENIKFVVYESKMKSYVLSFFELIGVDKTKIIFSKDCSRFSQLYVADTSYRTHRAISDLYLYHIQIIRYKLNIKKKFRKIFLSRGNITDRPLLNRISIETLFEKFEYEVIYPEKMSLEEQIRLVIESDYIAGEVGSQMYLSQFADKGTVISILAPSNFYLQDDYLLSSITKTKLFVLLGTSIDFNVDKKERSWTIQESEVFDLLQRYR